MTLGNDKPDVPAELLSGSPADIAFVLSEKGTVRSVSRGEFALLVETFLREEAAVFAEARARKRPIALLASPTLSAFTCLTAALVSETPVLPIHPLEPGIRRGEILRTTGAVAFFDESSVRQTVEETSLAGVPNLPELPALAALILGTSGTSGRSKWVIHSYSSLCASVRLHRENLPWRENDRWLLSLPFSHVGGFGILFRGLLDAKTTVVDSGARPGVSDFSRRLEDHRVTILSLVPTQLSRLVQTEERCPRSIRAVLVGGALCTDALRKKALSLGYPFIATYGLTEFGSQVATQSIGSNTNSVGRPLGTNRVVLDSDGRIFLDGPSRMLGYWGSNDPPTEFFRTNDHGSWSAENELIIRGRLDQVIISGGENIEPEQVEAAACDCAGVLEALANGEPHEEWGQQVVLRVVVAREHYKGDCELENELRSKLPAFAVPKRIMVVDSLPKTTSGKLRRSVEP